MNSIHFGFVKLEDEMPGAQCHVQDVLEGGMFLIYS